MEASNSFRIKTLLPYISGSDILLTGEDNHAVGLSYEEENMFAPVILFLEHDIPVSALKEAAGDFGVPVIANISLVKNLFAYGKLGNVIPELCCREIATILGRSGKKHVNSAFNRKTPVKLPRPIKLELGVSLMDLLGDLSYLNEGLERIRKRLSRLMGYCFPSINILANSKLKGGEYRVLLKGIEAFRSSVEIGWYKTVDLGLEPEQLRSAALAAASSILENAEGLIQKRAPELLGRDEVHAILEKAEKKYPIVTGEVKSLLSLGSVRDILRGLLSEHVSIRHILIILETLADWGGFGPAPNEIIIEHIRQSLKRQICMEYADDKLTLHVLTLETRLEEFFSDRAMLNDHTLNPVSSVDEWLEAFTPAIRGMEEKGHKPVILCSPVARLYVKDFTRTKFPSLAVLSYVEIPSDIKVEPVGEITLAECIPAEKSPGEFFLKGQRPGS